MIPKILGNSDTFSIIFVFWVYPHLISYATWIILTF